MGPFWDHFGVILGTRWAVTTSLGHFGVTLQSLLVWEGPFSKEQPFCQIDVNDLSCNSGVNLGLLPGRFGVALGT